MASLIFKLNTRYNLKIIQTYATTATYSVKELQKTLEIVLPVTPTYYIIILGNFNAQIDVKQDNAEVAIGKRILRNEFLIVSDQLIRAKKRLHFKIERNKMILKSRKKKCIPSENKDIEQANSGITSVLKVTGKECCREKGPRRKINAKIPKALK